VNAVTETSNTDLPVGAPDTEKLEDKIIFILTAYPRLMPSMLHVGIGPHVSPRVWRPVLDQMIAKGIVICEQMGITTPIGQYRTITVLRLANPTPLESLVQSYQDRIAPAA
jgi:hypothetical protein